MTITSIKDQVARSETANRRQASDREGVNYWKTAQANTLATGELSRATLLYTRRRH